MGLLLLSILACGTSGCTRRNPTEITARERPTAVSTPQQAERPRQTMPSPLAHALPRDAYPDTRPHAVPRGHAPDQSAMAGPFPRPASLEPAVAFWRKIYSVWRRSQVVIHDDRLLDVIYEVVDLPAPVAESLTQSQKDVVMLRKNYWKARLLQLESKLRERLPLDGEERRVLASFQASGRPQLVAGAADRVHSQRGTQERFVRGIEISSRYDRIFRQIFREAGLPEDLAYLPHVESSFQAEARSSAGAVGIWQFTRGAAERFMTVNSRIDERLDPIASARGAARYLAYAYAKLRDWPTALTSYNVGINGMMRAQNQLGNNFVRIVHEYDHPNFGFASRNYYAEFLAARDIARNPEGYLAYRTGSSRPLD